MLNFSFTILFILWTAMFKDKLLVIPWLIPAIHDKKIVFGNLIAEYVNKALNAHDFIMIVKM